MQSSLKLIVYGLCHRRCHGKVDEKKKWMGKGRRGKEEDLEKSGAF